MNNVFIQFVENGKIKKIFACQNYDHAIKHLSLLASKLQAQYKWKYKTIMDNYAYFSKKNKKILVIVKERSFGYLLGKIG